MLYLNIKNIFPNIINSMNKKFSIEETYIVLILFLILYLLYTIYHKHELSKNIHSYCINLEDNKDRWQNIQKDQKQVSFNIHRIDAVDTRKNWEQYRNELTREAAVKLRNTINNGVRPDHQDLSPGAIGCFLSHLKIYELVLKKHKKDDIILILEDDNKFVNNFENKLHKIIKTAPQDWDIILLGYYDRGSVKVPNNKNFRKIKKFYLMNCYLISISGIKKILNNHNLIYNQIDSYLSDLENTGVLNIYCSTNKISHQASPYTNIQIYGVK
jgi:GR25 family glycosyltransferase involved in LPS biosynthesis